MSDPKEAVERLRSYFKALDKHRERFPVTAPRDLGVLTVVGLWDHEENKYDTFPLMRTDIELLCGLATDYEAKEKIKAYMDAFEIKKEIEADMDAFEMDEEAFE